MISVITPSFRQPDWLRLCARSVADQEGAQYEHIVQEGSDDITFESSVSQFPKLRFYREPDLGMYDAINRGLRKARGVICCYLNCDEQLLPGALAEVVSFFDAHPDVDVLFGDAILIDRCGKPISYRRIVLPTLGHVYYVHLNTQSCSMFFRRSLLDRGFFFDSKYKAIGDQVWMERLLLSNVRMATHRKPLAVFTFTGQNLGSTKASEEEAAMRRDHVSVRTMWRKSAAVISHRLRKLFAGAYRRREIDIEIYTLESPSRRQHRDGCVGFSWPNK
jgi:glycosyltransferase involved in cell wall biosynthesis